MSKIYILITLFSLFSRVVWGGDARIRVEGVKSMFVAVATPELQQFRTALHDGKGGDVEFVVKDADASVLYCLGVNNKVCFFSLQPGAQIRVKIGMEGFEFSGDGAERNRRLYRLSERLFYSLPNVWVNSYMSTLFCSDFLTVDPVILCDENYVEKVQELFRQCRHEVQQWTDEPLTGRRCWQKRLEQMYWDAVVSTYSSLRYDRRERPRTLLKEMDRMPFTDTPYMLSHEGRVWTYNFLLVQEELRHFSFSPDTYLAEKARCIPNRIVREEYVLRELARWVDAREVLYLEESLNSCGQEVRSSEGKKRYREIAGKARLLATNDTLNGIQVAFSFENQDGKVVSSADFRGKYLYVDIWATWCAPCKQEMPYMQELEKKYGGGNIVFVSLSSDRKKDKEKWLAYLKEHHIEGVNLIASDGLSSPFICKFGVTAIPRFMLIGPDGKMISHNCWRPSDPRMKILLEKLNRAG